MFSCGRGESGELGKRKVRSSTSFQPVMEGVSQISAGKDHSLAIRGSKVFGWGNSKEGQLGLPVPKNYNSPQELNVYPCSSIFAGVKYSLFVTTKGVYGTGLNTECQLGLGHDNSIKIPKKLAIQD